MKRDIIYERVARIALVVSGTTLAGYAVAFLVNGTTWMLA